MLKRPSSRRKSSNQGIVLNLVPILDAMVTLIGFLLFTMSFLALVSIESPLPQVNPKELPEKIQQRPLQLTVSVRERETEIWSPFERIKPMTIQNQGEGLPDLKSIHEALISVKQRFPTEMQIVLVPFGGANYDTLVSVMDAIRVLEPTDPPIFTRNQQTGIDEPVKTLFPNVVFGNLLGES